jgi:hypothetical protein
MEYDFIFVVILPLKPENYTSYLQGFKVQSGTRFRRVTGKEFSDFQN